MLSNRKVETITTRRTKGTRRRTRRDGFERFGPFPPLLRSFQNQPISLMRIPTTGQTLVTTVTTGVALVNTALDSTAVADWANRFASLYEEYRIVGAEVDVLCFSSTTTGLLRMYFDEKSAANPTVASVTQRSIRDITCSSNRKHTLKWTVVDVGDMAFTATTTNYTPVYFKLYTDTANFGAPSTVTAVASINYWLMVQFRGYST